MKHSIGKYEINFFRISIILCLFSILAALINSFLNPYTASIRFRASLSDKQYTPTIEKIQQLVLVDRKYFNTNYPDVFDKLSNLEWLYKNINYSNIKEKNFEITQNKNISNDSAFYSIFLAYESSEETRSIRNVLLLKNIFYNSLLETQLMYELLQIRKDFTEYFKFEPMRGLLSIINSCSSDENLSISNIFKENGSKEKLSLRPLRNIVLEKKGLENKKNFGNDDNDCIKYLVKDSDFLQLVSRKDVLYNQEVASNFINFIDRLIYQIDGLTLEQIGGLFDNRSAEEITNNLIANDSGVVKIEGLQSDVYKKFFYRLRETIELNLLIKKNNNPCLIKRRFHITFLIISGLIATIIVESLFFILSRSRISCPTQ